MRPRTCNFDALLAASSAFVSTAVAHNIYDGDDHDSAVLAYQSTGAALYEGQCGIFFNNTTPVPMFLSGDWAAEDYDEYGDQLASLEFHLEPSGTLWVPTYEGTSPKIFVSFTNNSVALGAKRNSDTVVEATFNSANDHLYFDVDIEKGFSVPVWCRALGPQNAEGSGCVNDVLGDCPEQYRHYDEVDGVQVVDQCTADQNDPESVARFRNHCPHTYVFWDDQGTRVSTVSNGRFFAVCLSLVQLLSAPIASFH